MLLVQTLWFVLAFAVGTCLASVVCSQSGVDNLLLATRNPDARRMDSRQPSGRMLTKNT